MLNKVRKKIQKIPLLKFFKNSNSIKLFLLKGLKPGAERGGRGRGGGLAGRGGAPSSRRSASEAENLKNKEKLVGFFKNIFWLARVHRGPSKRTCTRSTIEELL